MFSPSVLHTGKSFTSKQDKLVTVIGGVTPAGLVKELNLSAAGKIEISASISEGADGDGVYTLGAANVYGAGTAVYASATTLTVANLHSNISAILTGTMIVKLVRFNSAGLWQETIDQKTNKITFSSPLITVAGMAASAGDLFVVYIEGPPKGYSSALDQDKVGIYDAAGNQITAFGSPSTVSEYRSPSDFTAVFASNITLTLASLPIALTDDSQIVYIRRIPAVGADGIVYVNGSGGVTFREVGGVLTIYGAGTPFVNTDVYEVGINLQDKAYHSTDDIKKVIEELPWNDRTVLRLSSDTLNINGVSEVTITVDLREPFNGLALLDIIADDADLDDVTIVVRSARVASGLLVDPGPAKSGLMLYSNYNMSVSPFGKTRSIAELFKDLSDMDNNLESPGLIIGGYGSITAIGALTLAWSERAAV